MIRPCAVFLAAIALIAATPKPSPSKAPTATPSPTSVPSGVPSVSPSNPTFQVGLWTVHMTQVDANFKTGDFSTPAKIVLLREGGDITGDRASGNFKTKNMTIYGHVVMHDSQGNFAGLSSAKPSRSRGPATLTADQVHIDGAAKKYTATGHVHYVRADTTTDADTGTLDDVTHELDLRGNVHMVQGDQNMDADHVIYNTVTDMAHAEGNPVTLQFPSEINPKFATPKPIKLKVPGQKTPPKATPQPSPSG